MQTPLAQKRLWESYGRLSSLLTCTETGTGLWTCHIHQAISMLFLLIAIKCIFLLPCPILSPGKLEKQKNLLLAPNSKCTGEECKKRQVQIDPFPGISSTFPAVIHLEASWASGCAQATLTKGPVLYELHWLLQNCMDLYSCCHSILQQRVQQSSQEFYSFIMCWVKKDFLLSVRAFASSFHWRFSSPFLVVSSI